MYIRPEQIAEQYEMEVKSISKGRDCFLCETDLGMRALKEYRGLCGACGISGWNA